MTARILYTPDAVADLGELGEYLQAEAGPRVAAKWIRKLRATIRLLGEQPLVGRADDELGPGRRRIADRPYVIVYEVQGTTVRIVRVLDGRRDLPKVMARWDL